MAERTTPRRLVKHSQPIGCSTHRQYALSCQDFDELWDRAAGRCQICLTPPESTPCRLLHIDHSSALGMWAVRGLLCSRCNTLLPRLSGPAIDEYWRSSWYEGMLARYGLSADCVEPSEGVAVQDPLGRVWQRQGDVWLTSSWRNVRPRTWRELSRRYGPRHLLSPPD